MEVNARDAILSAVRKAKQASQLEPMPHPGVYAAPVCDAAGRAARFLEAARAAGAQVRRESDIPSFDSTTPLFVGVLGVAESGAIWVHPASSEARQQLFLAEHVVLVVRAETLVETLHDAYARLTPGSAPFACFVAGPSKTADIEQAVVIGAHGPISLEVVLVDCPAL